jgi:hypothetical protein
LLARTNRQLSAVFCQRFGDGLANLSVAAHAPYDGYFACKTDLLAVMRGWAWAYPAILTALGLLIGYQSYQLWRVFSVGLTALTIFDVLLFVLTWHEYRLVRISKRDA